MDSRAPSTLTSALSRCSLDVPTSLLFISALKAFFRFIFGDLFRNQEAKPNLLSNVNVQH